MEEIIKKIDKLILIKDYFIVKEELIEIYYELGKYLYIKKLNIDKVENILRNKYGLLIGFTKRNLKNMYNFYKIYKDYDINKIKKINWDTHLLIMKKDNKDELINLCIKYNITKHNLEKIIKNGFDIKYIDKEKLKNDNMTLEFISLFSDKI